MSLYAGAARERIIQVNSADVELPPVRSQRPHLTVSPRTAQGLPTQGIALTLIEARVGAALGVGASEGSGGSGGGGGFNVTIYRAVPSYGGWAELAPFATEANYGEQIVLADLPGGWGLYFQITGTTRAGRILLAVAELD